MEKAVDLQGALADVAVYRRDEVERFVGWARSSILRWRTAAEDAELRARAAEELVAAAESRARAAERAVANRDRNMQAILGRALLMVQETADRREAVAAERAERLMVEAQARADAIVAEAEGRARALAEEDDVVLAPLRAIWQTTT